MFLHTDSKDSDQTGLVPRLSWVFAGCTGHFVGFVVWQLICLCPCKAITLHWELYGNLFLHADSGDSDQIGQVLVCCGSSNII